VISIPSLLAHAIAALPISSVIPAFSNFSIQLNVPKCFFCFNSLIVLSQQKARASGFAMREDIDFGVFKI
jgi:hypothetical protein